MRYLLEKYQQTNDDEDQAELPFQDIVAGEQLWVKQYSLEVGRFIGGRT
jgi:hypothetical protein